MLFPPYPAQPPSSENGRDEADTKEKLSARLVVVLAIGLVVLGIGGAVGASFIPESETVGIETARALSEAFIVTGITTLIVSFALLDDVRVERIVRSVLVPRITDVLQPKELRAVADSAIAEHLPNAVGEICSRIAQAETVSQQIAGAYVLHRSEIYPRSITLLHEMHSGFVRILMSAEEDLTDSAPNPETSDPADAKDSNSGAEWVEQLTAWLRSDFDGNHLVRVIATRPQSTTDIASARDRLIQPFVGTNANQWIYPDSEFSVSILLLGDRHAIFGFLPRRSDHFPPNTPRMLPRTTRLEYGIVISNRMLVKNLITWFEDRYTKDDPNATATKIMTKGEIAESAFDEFANRYGNAANDESVEADPGAH
jgi:hypothetical protein